MTAAPNSKLSNARFRTGNWMNGIRSRLATFALLMTAAVPAMAGVGLGVAPSFPTSLKAGMTNVAASLVITWQNTAPNQNNSDAISNITLTPSCGQFISSTVCPAGSVEAANPITLSSTGTGVGCGATTNFIITPPGTGGGAYTFTPGFILPKAGMCTISFTFNVVSTPTKDADPALSGIQTAVLAGAAANDVVIGTAGGGLGTAEVSFPAISTTPGAGGTLGATPVNLSDSALIIGLTTTAGPLPSGAVTFSLYPPSDPTCAGVAFQQQVVSLTGCTIAPVTFQTTCATSNTFTANAAGVWHWAAAYSGDADNVPIASPCAAEPVTVAKATPTLPTTPNPVNGTVGGAALNDSAQLTGGFSPYTGSVTFNLFDPQQAGCAGVPRYTQSVNVNGAGLAATTPGFVADKTGTWNWTASYSGDANNNAAASSCGAEPVSVGQPVLSIVKTPKSTTYTAGQTITFTIVVTNAGPGTATNVRFAPADALPDPNSSLNWTISQQPAQGTCTVAGAAGAQALNCNFGNLAQGAAMTVAVSTPTQASDPGDCGNPLLLNNSATVIADNAAPKTDTGSQSCRMAGAPTLSTTPTPASGSVGGGVLNDSAQLAGGITPYTGTIAFSLYDPAQANCTGVARFTQTVTVSATGAATTTGGFAPDKSGTW